MGGVLRFVQTEVNFFVFQDKYKHSNDSRIQYTYFHIKSCMQRMV